ncbi:cellulase family glycosylhydrolase [Fibrella aquatilis]|uniref:Cellulase family glycosylhydrolase n=1 Tax=Fibrella aquatilis TaxID=2817059 RepID=A0A939JZ13_9BACT|nr:cellulase family glycosylhydrolase [Fibrella aquatilis]MBO0930446.1 cellulase family glycosylhydrolase [Fibrella aquatilis]
MLSRLLLLFAIVGLATSLFAQPANMLRLYAPNPHYLAYNGQPVVLIGSGEHYGSVVNLDFDFKKYLQATTADGLNTTRLFTGAYVEKLGDFGIRKNTLAPVVGRLVLPWQRSNDSGYALGGNKFDLTSWDEAYFTRLNDFLAEAQRNGIIVEVNLFSAHYGGGWNYSAFNPKNNVNSTDSVKATTVNTLQNGNILGHQERYVREIVRRVNGFGNLYFEIQNEPWADQSDVVRMHNAYGPATDWRTTLQVVSQRSNDWQRQVASWITDEEKQLPVKHLISQDISNFHYPITNPDPNVSIFTFHYASPDAVRENSYLNKVIGFNETGFAGQADSTYRRQAWRFLFSGGGLFNQLDYSYAVGSETGTDSVSTSPGGGGPALRAQFKVLANLLKSLNVSQLSPDERIVKAAPGTQTWAMSNGKTRWAIYCETLATKPYDLTLNLPKGTYTAEWIDAKTGKSLQRVAVKNGVVQAPAGVADRVVVIGQ